jgi:hypothetical protein
MASPVVFANTDPETIFRAAEMFIFPDSFRLYQRANNRLLIFDCWADKDDFGPVSEDPALTVEVLAVANNSVAYIRGADSGEVAALRAHLKALAAGKQPPEPLEPPEDPENPPSAGDPAQDAPPLALWEIIPDIGWDRVAVKMWCEGKKAMDIGKVCEVEKETVYNRLSVLRRNYPIPTARERRTVTIL